MNERCVRSSSAITRSAFDWIERIGQPDVRDAGLGEHLGLAELRAADADGAALDLPARDQRALVRLGVRTEANAASVAAACIRSRLRSALARSIRTAGVRSDSSPHYCCVFFFAASRFLRARAAHDALEAVVGFVARILVDHLARRHRVEHQLTGKRRGERRRILDGEAIVDGVRVPARQPLGDLEVLPRIAEAVLGWKLVVSMTSVSPSQRPIESPNHFRMPDGGCVPFMRTTRASCTISVRIITVSFVCTMV